MHIVHEVKDDQQTPTTQVTCTVGRKIMATFFLQFFKNEEINFSGLVSRHCGTKR